MVSFIALYRGKSLSEAQLVGVSVRRDVIEKAVEAMLDDRRRQSDDAVAAALSSGQSRALELLRDELNDD